jgi:hypothetical protein
MALLSFAFGLPEINAFVSSATYSRQFFRVRLTECRGVERHDAVVRRRAPSAEPADWPFVSIALDGVPRAYAHGDHGKHIEGKRGSFAAGSSYSRVDGAHQSELTRLLLVQWDPAFFGTTLDVPLDCGRLSEAELLTADAVARALRAGDEAERLLPMVTALLCRLRSVGVATPVAVPRDASGLETRHDRVAAALSHALSCTSGLPAVVDVERDLDRSRAEVHRALRAYFEAHGFAIRSWRDFRSTVVLHVAAALLTAEGSTTESVARRLGFGSATALCHAFARAGLPSPGNLRAAILRQL